MTGDAVLTAASTIRCGHAPLPGGATVTVPPASSRLTVNDKAVLSLGPTTAVDATVAAGCPIPKPENQCAPKLKKLAGGTQRLTVDGNPVLLAGALDAQGTGTPEAKVAADAGHTLLMVTEEQP